MEYMLHMLDEKGEEFTFRFMKKYMIGKKEYPKLRKWKKKGGVHDHPGKDRTL